MKRRHLILTTGLLIAAALAIFGDKTPANQVVESVSRAAAPNQTALSAVNNETNSAKFALAKPDSHSEPTILELLPRVEVQNRTAAESSLFGNQNWTPPAAPLPPPPPPPPPMAPAIPFTYAGKRLVDGAWEVFLARGDTMLYVHNSSMIDSVYRIESISPPTLTMTYLPLNQKQTLPIGDAE